MHYIAKKASKYIHRNLEIRFERESRHLTRPRYFIFDLSRYIFLIGYYFKPIDCSIAKRLEEISWQLENGVENVWEIIIFIYEIVVSEHLTSVINRSLNSSYRSEETTKLIGSDFVGTRSIKKRDLCQMFGQRIAVFHSFNAFITNRFTNIYVPPSNYLYFLLRFFNPLKIIGSSFISFVDETERIIRKVK